MRISILSDTHNEIPPILLTQISGSDLILHAGDFESETILKKLEQIAPVAAVRGNCDRGILATLPEILALEREGIRFLMVHNLNHLTPGQIPESTSIIICGHTHVPVISEHKGVTYCNPGSPTMPRGGSRPGFIRITLNNGQKKIERINL